MTTVRRAASCASLAWLMLLLAAPTAQSAPTAAAQGASAPSTAPAPTPVPGPTTCAPVVFSPAGTYDAHSATRGPALILSGAGAGNMPAAALTWMRAHIGAVPGGRAGNVVILRASGERDSTDDFYKGAQFAWVQEVLVPPCATRAQVDEVAATIDRADAVFFSGGDQANYAAWKGSALIDAVRRVYARGGIVGGGSAGLAIQGAIVYDSVAADRLHPGDDDYNVTTKNAVPDPLEPEISFTTGLFDWPPLRNTIADTHFVQRDRFGRLVAFLARIRRDRLASGPLYGFGIDAGSVALVERDGSATLHVSPGSHGAYLLRMTSAPSLAVGRPLRAAVDVMHLARDGERFDLRRKRGDGRWYTVVVDGTRSQPYSRNPYR